MALSQYVGRTPRTMDHETTVTRAVSHCEWKPASVDRDDCDHCGAEVTLHERHVLVTTDGEEGLERHYLCDEGCVADWVGNE